MKINGELRRRRGPQGQGRHSLSMLVGAGTLSHPRFPFGVSCIETGASTGNRVKVDKKPVISLIAGATITIVSKTNQEGL